MGFDGCVADRRRPSTMLRATGEGGPVTESVTVMVTDQPSDPEVVSFSAKRHHDSAGRLGHDQLGDELTATYEG